MSGDLSKAIEDVISRLPPHEQAQLRTKLVRIIRHRKAIARFPTPGHLSQFHRPDFVQTPMLDKLDEAIMMAESGQARRIIVNTPPQEGKDLLRGTRVASVRYGDGMTLREGTEVPVGAAFRKIEDIQVGDYVFHPDGAPVRVEWKSEAKIDRTMYRVTTSDGRILDVDAEHTWTVQDRRREKSTGKGSDRVRWMEWEDLTTQEILDRGLRRGTPKQRANGTWTKANAIRLPRQCAIQTPDVDLPIEPYLFGLWLADGTHTASTISEGWEDADELARNIEDAGGATITRKTKSVNGSGGKVVSIGFTIGEKWAPDGFLARARALGVLGNKHIPDIYLLASIPQRLALLQGLLDGDGAISTNGTTFRVEYTTVIPELGEQVLFLVRSLGWRATVKDSRAMLDGVEKKRRYRVTFTPVQGEMSPFRLARKLARIQVDKSRGDERHVVTIDSIEQLPNGDGYCIRVDREDGLFLAGRDLVATHNTSRLQDSAAWMLLRNPTRRIVFASYEQSIAAQSSLEIRRLIETHGGGYRGQVQSIDHEDVLGLRLDPDRSLQTNWSLADVPGKKSARPGAVMAVGVGSALTGRQADIIIIDDPHKDAKQADSPVQRKAVQEWYRSVVLTRLPPKSIVIVVQTRWHKSDLSGWLLKEDAKLDNPQWLHLNIPAQAEAEDLLGRQPGEYLASARGRTAADWEETKIAVGSRFWFAMYQGAPAAPEGGIFKRAWFDRNRVQSRPADLRYVLTVIDPADNSGDGDEAGIMTGGVDSTGKQYLLADDSGHYTVGGWVRAGLYAMIRNGSSALGYEISLSGLQRQIKKEWKLIRKQAFKLARAMEDYQPVGEDDEEDWPAVPHGDAIADAMRELADEDDDLEDGEGDELRKQLIDMWPHVPTIVLRIPAAGFPLKRIRATGSKSMRAEMVAPTYERGDMHHVGHFTQLENQLATWLTSQDSPDRMDSLVHLSTELNAVSASAAVHKPTSKTTVSRRQVTMPSTLRSTRY